MPVTNNGPTIPVVAAVNLPAHVLVTMGGALCGLDTTPDWIGVTDDSGNTGQTVPVRMAGFGTCFLTASEAIAVGDRLYKAANGRVSKTATGSTPIGRAVTAASGAGSLFEAVLALAA